MKTNLNAPVQAFFTGVRTDTGAEVCAPPQQARHSPLLLQGHRQTGLPAL